MAENVKIIKTVIQVRRDTEANWLLNSAIIPAPGEPCLTLDGKHACQVKFGDGVHTWGELPYVGVGEFQADGRTIVIENNVIGIAGADTATAGQGFRISADGTSIEWFTPAAQEEVVSLKELINSTQTEVVSLKDIMNSTQAEVTSLKDIVNSTQSTVANLQELVDGKANASDVYTKEEVDSMVSGAFRYCGTVADMEELESIAEPKQGDVYQVTAESIMMVFDGDSWEEFGDTIDLSNYLTIEEANEAFDQVKSEILDNVVTDLPTADDDTLGVVKSAEGDNMVTVNEDGTMQVKSISWSSVVQAEGETIIMDGGGANV